jgi:arylformamidase
VDQAVSGISVETGRNPARSPPLETGQGWIDLSMPLSEDIPRWTIQFESIYDTFAHKSSTIRLPVHVGTHLDAPLHYIADGLSVDQFPLELATSEALIIDLTHVKANQCIELNDIAPRFPENHPETIVLRTDWPRRAFRRPGFWTDAPFICEEVAIWLADKQIKMIGYDFPQEEAIKKIASGNCRAEDFVVHRAFLSRGIWQIEYLINLHQLASERAYLVVSPLPLVGLEGSPVRVLGRGVGPSV